jgi:hypothetical protein
MMGGSGRGGGSMFRNNRQMKQYMQMRRDEMSHGAWLGNQNDALASERGEGRTQREADRQFNRDSLREDANRAGNDWEKNRDTQRQSASRWDANRVVTDFGKNNPHGTSFDADNAKGSWDPGYFRGGTSDPGPTKDSDGPRTVKSERVFTDSTGSTGSPARPALAAPAAKSARAPRAKREPGFVQQTLPGMRGTRQFKNTTLPPSTGSAATSTPIKSGNEINEVTGPKNAAGTGRTDLPTKFF